MHQLVHSCMETAMPISRFRGDIFVEFLSLPARWEFEGFTCGGSLGDNSMDAKSKGKVKMRPDWHNLKVDVMLAVARSKFARDADLRKKLRATCGQKLVEGHTGDKFWSGKSKHLGNILMRVRDELPETVQTEVPDEEDEAKYADSKCTRSGENENRRAEFKTSWTHGWSRVNQKVQLRRHHAQDGTFLEEIQIFVPKKRARKWFSTTKM